MQAFKSYVVTRLEKFCWYTPVLLLTGCSLSPSISVIGAYYPDWLFCIIAGVIVTLIARRFILKRHVQPGFPALVYTSLFALFSMLCWLVFF